MGSPRARGPAYGGTTGRGPSRARRVDQWCMSEPVAAVHRLGAVAGY
ncbi:hypothetical protein [Kribbella sp. NPDC051770]